MSSIEYWRMSGERKTIINRLKVILKAIKQRRKIPKYSMQKYSWWKKDLAVLHNRLFEEGYEVKKVTETETAALGLKFMKQKLKVYSDTLVGTFDSYRGSIRYSPSEALFDNPMWRYLPEEKKIKLIFDSLKRTGPTDRDRRLLEMYHREYRHRISRNSLIFLASSASAGVILAVLSTL